MLWALWFPCCSPPPFVRCFRSCVCLLVPVLYGVLSLINVVLPAPFGPNIPNSSPSRIWIDTWSKAVTGPRWSSPSPVARLRRIRRFFLPAKMRVRSRVSTAYGMADGVHSLSDRARASAGLDGHPLPVSGDVPGDPVAHQDAPHVGQLRDLPLVVLEVVREFVRIELREFDRDSLDVRRPDITQRFTPRQFEGALQRVCAK